MNRKGLISGIAFGSVVAFAAIANTACVVRTQQQPATVYTPPPQQAQGGGGGTVTVQSQPVVASGVTVIQQSCTPGAQEQCNGLDDNCDGAIDEGCGYNTGNIQITLAWNSGADIDLYVTDPYNETIYYGHTQSNSGGQLDHDGRGDCVQGPNNTIENVYWNGQPPHGTYAVAIHNYSGCNTAMGQTQTTLSIAVGGRILGSYSYGIAPEQRIQVTSFQL